MSSALLDWLNWCYVAAVALFCVAVWFLLRRQTLRFGDRGKELGRQGQFADALVEFDRALRITPKSASLWYNKGLCLQNLGKHQEALRCYDLALILQPDDAAAQQKRNILIALLRSDDKSG